MIWSPTHEILIRERYGKVRTRDLAAAIGRSVGAVKQRAIKLGITAARAHTESELRTVRELYPTHTALEIAERLYGTPERTNRVIKIVEKLGLKKWRFWPREVLDGVRALHAEGLIDRQIAERMAGTFTEGDAGRGQVRQIRYRLGLKANIDSFARMAVNRLTISKQFATLGIDNPNDLRKRAHRRFAARYGLPEDLRPAQVRIVLALVDGPLTLAELKAAIGAPPGSGLLHNGTKKPYQSDLVDRGLVVRVPTGLAGPVKGPRVRFMLAAACLDLLAAAPKEVADAPL